MRVIWRTSPSRDLPLLEHPGVLFCSLVHFYVFHKSPHRVRSDGNEREGEGGGGGEGEGEEPGIGRGRRREDREGESGDEERRREDRKGEGRGGRKADLL